MLDQTEFRVDCHILIDSDRSQQSAVILKQLADEPIHLWKCAARKGELTTARIEALSLGKAPYVCWVDDDDSIVPGVFQHLITRLDAHPDACGVFCTEQHVNETGGILMERPSGNMVWSKETMLNLHPLVHHIALMRRELIAPYFDLIRAFPRVGDQLLLWLLAEHGPWVHVPFVGYRWLRWPEQVTADKTVRAELEEAKRVARDRLGI